MEEQEIGARTGDMASQEENYYEQYGFRGVAAFFFETRQGGVTKS